MAAEIRESEISTVTEMRLRGRRPLKPQIVQGEGKVQRSGEHSEGRGKHRKQNQTEMFLSSAQEYERFTVREK